MWAVLRDVGSCGQMANGVILCHTALCRRATRARKQVSRNDGVLAVPSDTAPYAWVYAGDRAADLGCPQKYRWWSGESPWWAGPAIADGAGWPWSAPWWGGRHWLDLAPLFA